MRLQNTNQTAVELAFASRSDSAAPSDALLVLSGRRGIGLSLLVSLDGPTMRSAQHCVRLSATIRSSGRGV
jgi:hypothetical protein